MVSKSNAKGYTVRHLRFESYMIKNISPIHPLSRWWYTLVSRRRQRPNASLRSSNGFVRSRFSGTNQFFNLNLASSSPRQKRVRRRTRGERTSLMESPAMGARWLNRWRTLVSSGSRSSWKYAARVRSNSSQARMAESGTGDGTERDKRDRESERLPAARAESARSKALGRGSWRGRSWESGFGELDNDEVVEPLGVDRCIGEGVFEPNHRERLDAFTGMVIREWMMCTIGGTRGWGEVGGTPWKARKRGGMRLVGGEKRR